MNNDFSKVTIVLPSLNPDDKLNKVVDGLLEAGFKDIVLVNDGSDEAHLEPFRQADLHKEVTLLIHEVNKGKGRALKTAFSYVVNNRKDSAGVITVDGDNQHTVRDIKACACKMLECKDINIIWKDEILLTIISTEKLRACYNKITLSMAENNYALLKKTIFLINTCCRVAEHAEVSLNKGNMWPLRFSKP